MWDEGPGLTTHSLSVESGCSRESYMPPKVESPIKQARESFLHAYPSYIVTTRELVTISKHAPPFHLPPFNPPPTDHWKVD